MPIFDYIFNYDYIVTELCINKDRPDLACNGKCYLMQSLAQQADEEHEEKRGILANRYELPLLYFEVDEVIFDEKPVNFKKAEKQQFAYLALYTFLFNKRMVKPPIV
ncbi:hypothetical protein [Zunongwangia atlantica]|uniref:Uncharacterized protein n=1 Tax=Zunongwangia atlantica 22II14-10F7 TaxID=1185767 RepID=A0A1Y1T6V1_9FLAO|nr:hypothetical protein [Zunongwangia atlantica]ORL46314.1 hypothetical protein IIF7_07081 [Zunongwangia atlantica 22II14-10F7]